MHVRTRARSSLLMLFIVRTNDELSVIAKYFSSDMVMNSRVLMFIVDQSFTGEMLSLWSIQTRPPIFR